MYIPHKDPKKLGSLLPQFFGGEFILKEGHGKGTPVHTGKIEKVVVPDFSRQEINISCRILYRQFIGCNADFSDAERWKVVEPPLNGIKFAYSWFYQQPNRERLKLEFESDEGKNDKRVGNDERRWNDQRCWLCSATDPINLDLFRIMLMKMFLEEAFQKEQSLARRIRNRFMK